jgi:hypothetical protein
LVRHAQATFANLDVDLHRALLGAELVSGLADDSRPAASALGIVLVAHAFIPAVWAFTLFRREDTEINPTSQANRKLVTRGPYQFTRNPMYLGLVTLSLGIAVWIGAWPMFRHTAAVTSRRGIAKQPNRCNPLIKLLTAPMFHLKEAP